MGNGEAGEYVWLVMSPVIDGTGQWKMVKLVSMCGWCGGGGL